MRFPSFFFFIGMEQITKLDSRKLGTASIVSAKEEREKERRNKMRLIERGRKNESE